MKLIDANVLIYAHHEGAPQHARCRAWLEAALTSRNPVRVDWATVSAFLRITTSARIFASPLTMGEASAIVDSWFTAPAFSIIVPGREQWTRFRRVLLSARAYGNLVPDAYLAAVAYEHDLVLVSTDGDFRRFEGLRVENPLDEARSASPSRRSRKPTPGA